MVCLLVAFWLLSAHGVVLASLPWVVARRIRLLWLVLTSFLTSAVALKIVWFGCRFGFWLLYASVGFPALGFSWSLSGVVFGSLWLVLASFLASAVAFQIVWFGCWFGFWLLYGFLA